MLLVSFCVWGYKPNQGMFFWKASSHDLFSSTHWKTNLDLWTNERRLHHGYLKITWLHCKAMKRQALLPLFVGRCPSRPQKFNIDIHNLPYFQRRYMFQNHHFRYPFRKHQGLNITFQLHFKIRSKKHRFQKPQFLGIYVKFWGLPTWSLT